MRTFALTIAMSVGMLTTGAHAEMVLQIDGKDYPLSTLMDHCQSMADDQAKQVACFQAVSDLVEQQTAPPPVENTVSASAALEALQAIASVEDSETGLIIQGSGCNAQITYYANYFHISRRNVSSLDLYSVRFDASDFAYDQTIMAPGGQSLVATGAMKSGTVAQTFAGLEVESTQNGFAAKGPGIPVSDYALEVADQLAITESDTFDFVLVHPAKQQASDEIWSAFETYVAACQS